ncbi:AT-rich interactive domain-containing protein 5B-like [Chaetodon trifascialis]|uniref:AT-rich interactive domain-containing protein 5B-like n=1 Tax=Chaetodon trifascialis TaxID=109706 RepID=UPI0039912177
MESAPLTWVGSPCGFHGPYIFYRGFRFQLDRRERLLALGDFFFVRCQPGEPLCVAELQLLWEERTSHHLLSSSKLYFLPEDTPQGRSASHGEDEVIALCEKVVVRVEDLVKWTVWDHHAWNRGMKALPLKSSTVNTTGSRIDSVLLYRNSTLSCGPHFKDISKEKAALGEGLDQKQVLVLSYPQYCRYRSVVARLHEQPRSQLANQVVLALGGIAVLSENTHILYCRDTFHHPTLLHNKSICGEFAPNLKGRPRKKKSSNSLYCDSQGKSRRIEAKVNCQTPVASKKTETAGETTVKVTANKAASSKLSGRSNCSNRNHSGQTTTPALSEERRRRGQVVQYRAEEQAFLVSLYKYMKEKKTPIERIPYLGFKQVNLWTMFQAAQNLGGYELVTAHRQWKKVYDELGGNPGSTSAATCTRRHYERLILPYERFLKGEENKPLPLFKCRTTEASSSKGSSNSTSAPILKTNPCPEKNYRVETKDQDYSRLELMEQNSKLKLEPQICITRLDSLQPSHGVRKRQSQTQDCQNDTGIQLMLQHKDDVKRKRRYSACKPSYVTAFPMATDDKSVFPLTTLKIFNQAHSAMELWQHQQVPVQDQCHAGKPRNVQSPTIPEPPGEQAELPTTEHTSSGFNSSEVSETIMSPLAEKKLFLQVSSSGLPSQDPSYTNFVQPLPLITSSLTNCTTEEAAERPALLKDSSVVVFSRPSVIQHVQSFKAGVQKDRVNPIRESTPPPLYSHEQHFQSVPLPHSHLLVLSLQKEPQCPSTPLLTSKTVQSSCTPQSFLPSNDLISCFSHVHCWHSTAEKADGTVSAELVHDGYKRPLEQGATFSRDPNSLVGFLQSAYDLKYSAPTDQDKSSSPRPTASNDQPTDLSLPKSSLKPLHHPYTFCPLKCSTRYQESHPILSHNGFTAVNTGHYSQAKQVPQLAASPAKTCNPRQDPTVELYT